MSETEKTKSNKESSNTATNAPTTTAANKASGSSSTSSSTNSTSTTTSGSSSSTKHTSKVTSATPKLLPPPAPVSRPRVNASSEPVIKKAFADFMKDPECLDKAADYLYESLLDDAVVGVYLEVHHAVKSGALEALEGQNEDDTAFKIVDTPNYDVFGMSTARKAMDCNCPNCDRLVAASRFAPHLEKCMGMGRKTSRPASRRLANAKEGNFNYFSSNVSDDEDDADCSSEKRRKKIQTSRTNGSKKNGKSS